MQQFLFVFQNVLRTVVPLLLQVAFTTLCERRIMGAMQRRQGPNVWGFQGILQPFLDGAKLIFKEPVLPRNRDQPLFLWAPVLQFLTRMAQWAALPTSNQGAVSDLHLGTMYVLAVGSLGVYGVLLRGWASNSKYAFLGCCRSVQQMISYELPLGLVVLTRCVIQNSLNWRCLVEAQEDVLFLLPLWPMLLIWMVCSLQETNRRPFDLPEAEAELVQGYNVEYQSMGFRLFFIQEYRNLLLMGTITSLLFFGGTLQPFGLSWIPGSVVLAVKTVLVMFVFVWVRQTLPRYRYDQLMNLGWKALLPITLAGFVQNQTLVLTMNISNLYFLFIQLFIEGFFPVSGGMA